VIHEVAHGLSRDAARRAARNALEAYAERFAAYSPSATWLDEDHAEVAFSARGLTLRGRLEVGDGRIRLELEVPLLLRPFRERALAVVDREIRGWIERAGRGEA